MAAVAVYAVAGGGRFAGLAAVPAAAGLVLLGAAVLVRLPALVPWAVVAEGVAYLVGREGRALVDGWASVVGTLLLLGAELAAWSIEHDARIRSERPLVVRRVLTLGALVATALLVDFVLLGTAAVAAPAGVLLAAAGVAAAVAAVAVVLRLVRA